MASFSREIEFHMGTVAGSAKKLDFPVFFRYLFQTFVRCKRTDSETLHGHTDKFGGAGNKDVPVPATVPIILSLKAHWKDQKPVLLH